MLCLAHRGCRDGARSKAGRLALRPLGPWRTSPARSSVLSLLAGPDSSEHSQSPHETSLPFVIVHPCGALTRFHPLPSVAPFITFNTNWSPSLCALIARCSDVGSVPQGHSFAACLALEQCRGLERPLSESNCLKVRAGASWLGWVGPENSHEEARSAYRRCAVSAWSASTAGHEPVHRAVAQQTGLNLGLVCLALLPCCAEQNVCTSQCFVAADRPAGPEAQH